MGRPRKTANQHLPDNLRPKTCKRKSGKTVIYWLYRIHDKKEISLGKDRNLAFIKAAQMNLERGTKGNRITFGMVAKRYKDEVISQKKASTAQVNLVQLKPLIEFFHTAPLEEIEAPHIVEYMNRRKNTPGAANNEYSLFNHIWKYARQWGYTKLPSPAESVNKYPIKRRTNYVEDGLFKLIYQHANQDMKDLMDIAYLTGQRPVDLVNIERSHIFDGYLHIIQQKTQAKLRLELVGPLAEIIQRRLSNNQTYLFYNKKGEKLTALKLGQLFSYLRQKVAAIYPAQSQQILSFQFRDLRAKSGTDKAMEQGEEAARQQLGHTSVKMTKTYIRKAQIVTPITKTISNK